MKLREAEAGDEPALADFMLKTPIQSDTSFAMDRSPRFGALPGLRGQFRTFMVEEGGELAGMATALWRPGRDMDRDVTVGELLDVRIAPWARGGRAAYLLLGAVCETLRAHGASFLFCLIGNHNHAASILTGGRAGLPKLQPLGSLASAHLIALSLPRLWRGRRMLVRSAGDADAALVNRLFAEQETAERFAPPAHIVWPDPTGRHRAWVALGADGTPAGALVAWDGADVRRVRIMGYRPEDMWLRIGIGLLSALRLASPMPAPGGVLKMWATRLVTVRQGGGETLRALIAAALDGCARAGQNILQVNLHADDPLLRHLAPYPKSTFYTTLFGGPLQPHCTLSRKAGDLFHGDIARA